MSKHRLGRNPFAAEKVSEPILERSEVVEPAPLASAPPSDSPEDTFLCAIADASDTTTHTRSAVRDGLIEVATVVVATGLIAFTLARDWARTRATVRDSKNGL